MSAVLFGFDDGIAPARRLGTLLDAPTIAVEAHRFPDRECLIRVPTPAQTAIFYRSLNDPDHKIFELLLGASASRNALSCRI